MPTIEMPNPRGRTHGEYVKALNEYDRESRGYMGLVIPIMTSRQATRSARSAHDFLQLETVGPYGPVVTRLVAVSKCSQYSYFSGWRRYYAVPSVTL
jgi:hypothetical protein